jgi:anaerobic magnesium-protoporphyrin IX monomethyl ester cyclase
MIFLCPAESAFGGLFSRYMPLSVPIAVGTLAGYLKMHGINTRVFDEQVQVLTPSILRELVQEQEAPYIFGISCMTAHVASAYRMAAMIKSEYPDSIVIAGGIHPTALPEEPLRTGHVDFVVRGEGEVALLELYRTIRSDQDPRNLASLSFHDGDRFVHNPEGPMLPDLDELPMFPFDLFSHPRYDLGFLVSSRGCPYKCAYCSQRMMTGTTYRYKSAQRVIQELDVLINKYNRRIVTFYDDNFCIKKRRVLELCDLIVDANFHKRCKFLLQTRADNFPEDLAPILAESGFTMVGFGMETGSDRIANLIGKGETVQQHLDAVELAKRYNMQVMLYMINGLPTETKKDRYKSFEIIMKTRPHAPKFNNLIPYPGTPMFDDLKQSDRLRIEENWTNFDSTMSATSSIFDKTPMPYVPETTSEFELRRDIIKFNIRANLNYRSVINLALGKGELSWLILPPKWYLSPVEIYHLMRAVIAVVVNLIIATLPLWLVEPIMTALIPSLKERKRVKNYDLSSYRASGWDILDSRNKAVLLKDARDKNKLRQKSRKKQLSKTLEA